MTAARRALALAVAAGLLTSCGLRSASAASSQRPTMTVVPTTTVPARTASKAAAPSLADARVAALGWVGATGELFALGPIGRNEFLSAHVVKTSLPAMEESMATMLGHLSDGLPFPAAELRLLEAPITITATLDPATGDVHAQVWSVVTFGAQRFDAAYAVFRTSSLVLRVEDGAWKLASFTSDEGPTPMTTAKEPARWAQFKEVADWQSVTAGDR